jgi:hypothetical protein
VTLARATLTPVQSSRPLAETSAAEAAAVAVAAMQRQGQHEAPVQHAADVCGIRHHTPDDDVSIGERLGDRTPIGCAGVWNTQDSGNPVSFGLPSDFTFRLVTGLLAYSP